MNRLADIISRMLDPDEREAVRGDLEESGARGSSSAGVTRWAWSPGGRLRYGSIEAVARLGNDSGTSDRDVAKARGPAPGLRERHLLLDVPE